MKSNRPEGKKTAKDIPKSGNQKTTKLKTDEPLAEKDEVKKAEEELRQRLKSKTKH